MAALRLPFLRRMPANLADDGTINLSVYALTILWCDEDREVEVLATGRRPLLGTLLLDGTDQHTQWTDGGLVRIAHCERASSAASREAFVARALEGQRAPVALGQ